MADIPDILTNPIPEQLVDTPSLPAQTVQESTIVPETVIDSEPAPTPPIPLIEPAITTTTEPIPDPNGH